MNPDTTNQPVPQEPDPASSPAETSANHEADTDYISNPFLNALRGLVLTLKTNPAPALLAALAGLVFFGLAYVAFFLLIVAASAGGTVGLVFALLILAFIAIALLLPLGAYYVIGGSSARDEQVTTGEAYSQAFKRVLSFLGLVVLTVLILTVGFLLLIVPGVILAARLSLSGLVMFEENLGPIKALKRSFSLTKGHTNEMLGSIFAGAFLGGYYSLLFGAISVAPVVGRYHDLRKLQESGAPKPETHWLNYLYLVGVVMFVLPVFAIIIISAFSGFNDRASNDRAKDSSSNSEVIEGNFNGTLDDDYDADQPVD